MLAQLSIAYLFLSGTATVPALTALMLVMGIAMALNVPPRYAFRDAVHLHLLRPAPRPVGPAACRPRCGGPGPGESRQLTSERGWSTMNARGHDRTPGSAVPTLQWLQEAPPGATAYSRQPRTFPRPPCRTRNGDAAARCGPAGGALGVPLRSADDRPRPFRSRQPRATGGDLRGRFGRQAGLRTRATDANESGRFQTALCR
jgi:hypothetical protein